MDPTARKLRKDPLRTLLKVLRCYLKQLAEDKLTDFSLLQQWALRGIEQGQPTAGQVFRHVIIDEYQDTNTVQPFCAGSMRS